MCSFSKLLYQLSTRAAGIGPDAGAGNASGMPFERVSAGT